MFQSFSPQIWSRIAPFLLYMLFIVLADGLAKYDVAFIDSRWLYVMKVTAVGLLLWYLRKHYTELYKCSKLSAKHLGISVLAGVVVFIAWVNLDLSWMQIGTTSSGFNPTDQNGMNWLLVIARISGAALVVPIMEELFWRSFLMRWLVSIDFLKVEPQRVGWIALFVSSLLFAIEHNLWLAGFMAGLVYGLLYIRSGNVWVPMIAHAVTNAMLGFWVLYTRSWAFW